MRFGTDVAALIGSFLGGERYWRDRRTLSFMNVVNDYVHSDFYDAVTTGGAWRGWRARAKARARGAVRVAVPYHAARVACDGNGKSH